MRAWPRCCPVWPSCFDECAMCHDSTKALCSWNFCAADRLARLDARMDSILLVFTHAVCALPPLAAALLQAGVLQATAQLAIQVDSRKHEQPSFAGPVLVLLAALLKLPGADQARHGLTGSHARVT